MTAITAEWQAGWAKAQELIRAELTPECYSTFFNNARALGLADNCLTIGTANVFVRDYIERNHRELLAAALREAFGAEVAVKIVISPELYRERLQQQAAWEATARDPEIPLPEPEPREIPLFSRSGTTFANFVAGRCNEFALAAARRAVQAPGEYSPLVLSGGHGLGKTHLLHAICHETSQTIPARKIICQTADGFVRAFARAVVDKRLGAFRERYEQCELLAVDDFQALGEGSRLASQKEFTQIVEEMLQRRAQVVLATSLAPNAIDGLYRPLASRLRQGLLARLDPLDENTRLALLRQNASGLALPDESLEFLCGALRGDAREIEGTLNKLRLRATLSPAPLTPEVLNESLEGASVAPQPVAAADIIAAVSHVYGVPAADICGQKRHQSVVQARRAAAHLCRRLTGGSLGEIGKWLGGRTHATILSLLKQPPFTAASPLERQKFAAVLARCGHPARPEDFIEQTLPLFD